MFDLLGWITIGLCIVLLVKFIGRISKIKSVNKLLRVTHIPLGIAALVTGAVHTVYYIITEPNDLAENISGVFLWAIMAFLAITYIAKSRLKSTWFFLHRLFSVILIIVAVVHLAVVM